MHAIILDTLLIKSNLVSSNLESIQRRFHVVTLNEEPLCM